MTPAQFIAKWQDNPLSERAGSQAFFLDLCTLLDVPPPNDPDNYCFERGATRTGAGHGWADVWKRGHFGWENKGPGGDLGAALRQLMTYALALDNPPLLVVSNRDVTHIHTHFTGTPSETWTIRLADIGTPDNLQRLRWLFTEPERFRPGRTVQDITADAAGRFAGIAGSLTGRGHDPARVAHFLIQCLFCMFAEDIGLLPARLFERVIAKRQDSPAKLAGTLREMFAAMRAGGDFLLEDIAWFNGGLFEHVDVPELIPSEIDALAAASRMDWSAIEPSILGTLFERGLDPKVRAPLGANYTDPDTIMKLVQPVVVAPLAQEWEAAKARIAPLMARYHAGGKGSQKARQEAQALFLGHLARLRDFRVLDPACGSGNFLYLALRALKDLEHRANLDAEALGLHRELGIETSPANVRGIEINAYAAELARVTVWIGEIQWMLRHGYDVRRDPILAPLNHIEHRDALLAADDSEATWPAADVIVGNPPFLGDKRLRSELGAAQTETLRACYAGRVPGGADLVLYWFEKARAQIAAGQCEAAGFVGTNSIRGGANRKVLDRIVASTRIFAAWSDEPWVNEGAAVRVSLVCFGGRDGAVLDGAVVSTIHSDLGADTNKHAPTSNLPAAVALPENEATAFSGITKKGKFNLSRDEAEKLLFAEGNPHGLPNTDVVFPWMNGDAVTGRNPEAWIINFKEMSESEAQCYAAPFEYVTATVKQQRLKSSSPSERHQWWKLARRAPAMFSAIRHLNRFIVTPETAKHRTFSWLQSPVVPDKNLVVIARDDDTTFGILHSRFHEVWALRLGTSLEDRPRYTSTTTFRTFPFPAGLTPADTDHGAPDGAHAEAIAAAARRLVELRDAWLNPAEWIERVPEIVPGYPDRLLARAEHAAELKKRTLTNLYNQRPAWLTHAHQTLDHAVAAAYGWPDYSPEMPDEELLRRLLALNLERAGDTT